MNTEEKEHGIFSYIFASPEVKAFASRTKNIRKMFVEYKMMVEEECKRHSENIAKMKSDFDDKLKKMDDDGKDKREFARELLHGMAFGPKDDIKS